MNTLAFAPTSPQAVYSLPATIPASAEVPIMQVQVGVEIPNRVFVGGCPYSMTEKELGDFFCQFGPVKDSKIVFDKASGKSLGYGFVTYICEADAVNVYNKGSIFYNEKKLNVSKAIRKHGGQYVRPNQEYNNMYVQPNGYFVGGDGLWRYQAPQTQPVSPYFVYMAPSMQQQPTMQYSLQTPTLTPMASAAYIPQHHSVYQSPLKVPPIALQAPPNQAAAAIEVIEIETSTTVTTSSSEQDSSVESDKENTFKPINSSLSSDEQGNAGTDLQGVDLDRIFERRNTPPRKRPSPQKAAHYVYPQYPGQFPQPVYQTAGYVPM